MITVIANLKGGSGKSTIAFNLGIWLARKGQPVVAYDLDPQCTLVDVAGVRREEGYAPPFQVYHAQESLAEHLIYHPGEVIVDVGAANLTAMKAAIQVAERVLVPVPPSQPDVWATQRFLTIVNDAVGDGKRPDVLVFVNRADTHPGIRESDDVEALLAQLPGVSMFPHRLSQRTIYRRSLSEGQSVSELWSGSKGSKEFDAFAGSLYPDLAELKAPRARQAVAKGAGA